MLDKRIKIISIIENQLPQFIKEEFPLVEEFLKQYYQSLDNQSGIHDIIQNIDQYVKIDNILHIVDQTTLVSDVSFFDETIKVKSTYGFPDQYGLIQINSEIITYTHKTPTSFEGCVRGFSATTSYGDSLNQDKLIFTETESQDHLSGSIANNLSVLFLKQFLVKIKTQITPGFENRKLFDEINQRIFIKQAKDFYKSKGTEQSFKILFYLLYGEPVSLIRPSEYLIRPSDAQYRITKDLVVESLSGNPFELENGTLYQDADDFFPGSRGTITYIEQIYREANPYYLLKLDYDYNKDINVLGSIKGEFKINPRTKVTSYISAGFNYIDVDSTLGFPESGELTIKLSNGTNLIVDYKSKTLNQFFECSEINQDIPPSTEINLNKYVYGYSNKDRNQIVKLRITGVLENLRFVKNPYFYSEGDSIEIKTLGTNLTDFKSNSWFFNISTTYEVKSLEQTDKEDETYRLVTYDDHNFVIGDSITLTSSSGNILIGNVIFVDSKKVIKIRGQGILDVDLKYTVKKNISKVNISNYPELNFYSSNVQNVYSDLNESIYITSPSLPTYLNQSLTINDESITFYGTFGGYDLTFADIEGRLINHSFLTGDSVIYKSNSNSPITTNGLYFVTKINQNTIKLSRSRENIFNNQFIRLEGQSFGDQILLSKYVKDNYDPKKIKSQSIIRKLSKPVGDGNDYETDSGTTGILINGVEILNYKSNDIIFYGGIRKLIPTSKGSGYDVINPPSIVFTDTIGTGCSAICSVEGKLSRIDIVDQGFDYLEVPRIIINGGGGTGARARANLVSYDHIVKFNASSGINTITNVITSLSQHKFRDSERVIYNSEGNSSISGLSTNSTYYTSVKDEYGVTLHKSISDSAAGINAISISTRGYGIHTLKSLTKKNKIGSIDIIDPGSGYKNRKTYVSGVNTSLSYVSVKDHQYKTGDIVKYYSTGTPIGGLENSISYYVTKIDENNFRLSQIYSNLGITTTIPDNKFKDFYFKTERYVRISSNGTGENFFNYEPIEVKVAGKVGISSVITKDFNAILNPVFRGEIYSIFIVNEGRDYGSNSILNYNRQPLVVLDSGSGCQLSPVVYDGKIVDVVIQSNGNNYISPPDLVVRGNGRGCILSPIIQNGKIVDIKIISSGLGYLQKNTSISVINSGQGCIFECEIESWRINNVERKLSTNKISDDDGFLTTGVQSDYELKYTHSYAPRSLRASVLATKFQETVKYVKDLELDGNYEKISDAHSPIIGWAYDGNPIYGPYAYSITNGYGQIVRMKSGYQLKSKEKLSNRPNTSNYPIGFFVEDYEYTGNGDLDEFNGRFCITPEYPNGIYAYFCTIDPESLQPSGSGTFTNYYKPIFPYIIGNKYKSNPIDFNFKSTSNQKDMDLNATGWIRNTTPYNLLDSKSKYDYLFNPNKIQRQISKISNVSAGSIDKINVVFSGNDYKVGDKVIFDENSSGGRGLKAEVESIKGEEVNRIYSETIEFNNVELVPFNSFLGITTDVYELNDGDIVRITTPFEYDVPSIIKIKPLSKLSVISGIGSTTTTGLITSFNVTSFPHNGLYEGDFFKIENETVQILNINKKEGKIKVYRNVNGITTGITSYKSGQILIEAKNKFITELGLTTSYNFNKKKSLYFESNRVVGLGTTYGVGITSTIFLDVQIFNSKISIKTAGIGNTTRLYFERSRERDRYALGNFVNIANSTTSGFNTSRCKIVGISTPGIIDSFIDVNFNPALSVGTGVTGYVNKWKFVQVPTRTIELEGHGLEPETQLVYFPPTNGNPIKVIDPKFPNIEYDLNSNIPLYAYPIDEKLIGISSVKLGVTTSIIDNNRLLMFSNPGTNDLNQGKIHKFETTYSNSLTARIIKNLATVETKKPHNLKLGDKVQVSCITNTLQTVKVSFNGNNRRVTIGSYNFLSSDVNIENSTITIENHQFKNGQKIIHESSSPCSGLVDQQIYYVLIVDSHTIKLVSRYFENKQVFPEFISITSQSFGKISVINPEIQVNKFSTLKFDLSDPSLSFSRKSELFPAFELSLYKDSKFKQKFESSGFSDVFEVSTSGIVGVTSDASLIITFNQNVPENLFYKLTPINISINDTEKTQCIVDDELDDNSKITLVQSRYNGIYQVYDTDTDPYSFKYVIENYPEFDEYNQNNASIEYNTYSKNISGPINSIKIISSGKDYKSLPIIKNIDSDQGSNCLLSLDTNTIGKIGSAEIKDIGFNYGSDLTLKPKANLPQILKINPLYTIDKIDLIYGGKNYNNISPDLIVIDSSTNQVISNVLLKLNLIRNEVKIIQNTFEINSSIPKIIPVNNSNGIGISSIYYNNTTKDVDVVLSPEFGDPTEFPFENGDKILIENVLITSSGKGYNSNNYNYELFTITNIDFNIGFSSTRITYNLSEYLKDGEFPGEYDARYSYGRVIPEKYFPKFDTSIVKKFFSTNEEVFSGNSLGFIENWDQENKFIKVISKQDFSPGNYIIGKTSQTKAFITDVISFEGFYDISSSSIVKSGWNSQTGVLNNQLQRLHDSDYYQYFSYALRSKVSYNKWGDPVSNLNHSVGFKKFSDLIIESTPINSGVSTEQAYSSFVGISDLYNEMNLNCVYDFDLVTENAIVFDSGLKSNEIYFKNRILSDYLQSVGNRVLLIDDISKLFNSNPRPTAYVSINLGKSTSFTYKKCFSHVLDKRVLESADAEVSIISILNDENFAYINNYAKIYTNKSLGFFDTEVFGSQINLLYYPINYTINDYDINLLSFDLTQHVPTTGQISLGTVATFQSYYKQTTQLTEILRVPKSYRALKVIVLITDITSNYHEVDEISIICRDNGGEDQVHILEYGQLTSKSKKSQSEEGLGKYNCEVDTNNNTDLVLTLDAPGFNTGTYKFNSLVIGLTGTTGVGTTAIGIGTTAIGKNFDNYLQSSYTNIPSSGSPIATKITSYSKQYNSGYFIVSVEDVANDRHQMSEVFSLYEINNNEVYLTEFGVIFTHINLGTISASLSTDTVDFYFTPLPNINCKVKTFNMVKSRTEPNDTQTEDLNNLSINSQYALYRGTESDIRRDFELTHKNVPIFSRSFDSEDNLIVNIDANTIQIPQNYFVTGEEVSYVYEKTDSPIGIGTTTIVGIGSTNLMPSTVYIIKLDEINIQVAASCSDSLSFVPKPLNLTNLGIGNNHRFVSKKQNSKSLISIDGAIQSPLSLTPITTTLEKKVGFFDGRLYFTGITSFFGGDLIKIDDEIIKIISVGFGTEDSIIVDREVVGTGIASHIQGSTVTKIVGNYNIVENIIYFPTAPWGEVPVINATERGDELDYYKLEIGSKFSGRVFLRNSQLGTNEEPYSKNYIFDSILDEFNGINKTFSIKSNNSNITGFSTDNSLILINNVFQPPLRSDIGGAYELDENVGVTSITFIGSSAMIDYDINVSSVPRGGIIVSVGSTSGFGYQPLVAAGGTAIVSSSGTIQSIAIQTGGSGYRIGIQTFVNVGIFTESKEKSKITYIGTANISNGIVVGVSITNPGIGYTTSKPPMVVFDSPLSYSNIPLIYSTSSSTGFGTGAVVDIIVGQGSSVISFDIKNYGFGYKQREVLTVAIGGNIGIPTDSSLPFKEFQLAIDEIKNDSFFGWHFGDLQVLDPIDELFDGERKIFPIKLNGYPVTIRSRKNSNIDVEPTLLIFINDVLQIPGESYIFSGGSLLRFTEAPKGPISPDDPTTRDSSKIIFYRGTRDVDVLDIDVLETIEIGDELQINSDVDGYDQEERVVEDVISSDIVQTNLYAGEGIQKEELFSRPVIWCRQTDDKIINGKLIAKNRSLYEALINPSSNIIKNVGINDDEIFVDNVKTFFDSKKENNINNRKIVITSQDKLVSAFATATVSSAGTIQSINITNVGAEYSSSPIVTIQSPIGIGSTSTAISIVSNGSLQQIAITNPGSGYSSTNPPIVIIEPPSLKREIIQNVVYEGDFGRISGIRTTTIGIGSTGLILDFYIPNDSFIRDSNINNVGASLTGISGIKPGYYFVISNSNIGFGMTSLDSSGNVIGIGSTFIDGIYQAISVSYASTTVGVSKTNPGITTNLMRVTTRVSGYNGLNKTGFGSYYGDYSWGRISSLDRNTPQSFENYNQGLSGISTSPVVQRFNPLKTGLYNS